MRRAGGKCSICGRKQLGTLWADSSRFMPVFMTKKHEQCAVEIKAWVPPPLREKIVLAAARERRSVSNLVLCLLERGLECDERGSAAA